MRPVGAASGLVARGVARRGHLRLARRTGDRCGTADHDANAGTGQAGRTAPDEFDAGNAGLASREGCANRLLARASEREGFLGPGTDTGDGRHARAGLGVACAELRGSTLFGRDRERLNIVGRATEGKGCSLQRGYFSDWKCGLIDATS